MSGHLHWPAVLWFLAAAMTLGGNVASAAEAANTIRYAMDDEQNINRLAQVIAEREGFFKHEGLTVQMVPLTSAFRGPPTDPNAVPLTMREAMKRGKVDMARQQLPLLINDVVAGGTNIGVAVAASDPIYFLVARPEIKSFADLKGKTVTITNLTDGITIWTRKLMLAHGLKNDDVKLKVIAGSDARLACLKSGDCAAASLAQPAVLDALSAGYHSIGITNEIGPQLNQVDIVNPAWAAAHRDLVVKYVRATSAAMQYIQDPKNHNEVVKVTMAFMKEPEDRSRQMLAYIWDPKNRVFPRTSAIDANGIKAAIALMGEYDVLKQPLPAPERFVDVTYSKGVGQ